VLRKEYYILVFFWIRRVQVQDLTDNINAGILAGIFILARQGEKFTPTLRTK
jgi:hypothetical protein